MFTNIKNVFTSKTHLLIPPDEAVQSGFYDVHVAVHLAAPHLEAFLYAEGVHREDPEVADAVRLTCSRVNKSLVKSFLGNFL